jgi:hypothetical protein
MALLVVSLLSVAAIESTRGQEATPSSPYINIPEHGLTIDGMISSPNITMPADKSFSLGLQRLTFEPGVTLELNYAGPVEYFVEEGELGVTWTKDRNLTFSASGDYLGTDSIGGGGKSGEETILTRGQSVYSADGRLGPTRNGGSGKLVVYALLVVPDQRGVTWGVTGESNATPMNETEKP